MNTTTIANITIAILELFEEGLRKVISCSDLLQGKLELSKLTSARSAERNAKSDLLKLTQAQVSIERSIQRELDRVNALATARRAEGSAAYAVGLEKLTQKGVLLSEAYAEYVGKRGWEV